MLLKAVSAELFVETGAVVALSFPTLKIESFKF